MSVSARWMEGVSRLSVLTGAGISTDSGVPDYRGPNGVWTNDPDAVQAFTYDRFMSDAVARTRFWRTYAEHAAWRAEPNAGHRALVDLRESGLAVRVLTQNIDGLHQKAGMPGGKVLELHGSMHDVQCTGCGCRTSSAATLARVRTGLTDPVCEHCGAVVKLAVVLFGEHLDEQVLADARRIAAVSQLMLVVGTTLRVEPAASLCTVAVGHGARLVIINRDPTPYDDLAHEVIRRPIGQVLPELVAAYNRNRA